MTALPSSDAPDELAVSYAWHQQWVRRDALRTSDGLPLTVVYPGRWTRNFGPDFQGALLAFGAELRQGDIEIHLRSGGWQAHGHHLNTAYNSVILHVVLNGGPAQPCRRQDGVVIPTLVLGPVLQGSLAELSRIVPLAALPEVACAAEIGAPDRLAALAALERAGDARLTAKAAGYEAAFTSQPPGEVLYAGLLDALGYSRNREPARRLAALLSLAELDRRLPGSAPSETFEHAAALLLGVAGFLPASPTLAALSGLVPDVLATIERRWEDACEPWRETGMRQRDWSLARVRPANHPARRLLGLAGVLARSGTQGLLAACLEPLLADEPAVALAELRALFVGPARGDAVYGRYLGDDRVAEIIVNVLVPFALAYSAWSGDERLSVGAATLWEVLPASAGNSQTRTLAAQLTREAPLRFQTGRQQQGALHLYRNYCQHRRCYECPLAALTK